MLTLGLCNVAGSFFHSMPVTGSFSRSAVNNASGVRTPLGGIYTGKSRKIFTIGNIIGDGMEEGKLEIYENRLYP